MAAYERILIEMAEHIGTVTLNRPEKLNAFDPEACDDLIEGLRMLAAADEIRVIVVTGAGRAFCAGADLAVLGTPGGGSSSSQPGKRSPLRSATLRNPSLPS